MKVKTISLITAVLLTSLIKNVPCAETAPSSPAAAPPSATSAVTMSDEEADRVKSTVALMLTYVEACKQDHADLGKQMDTAFGSWRLRNQKYYDFAVGDPQTLQNSKSMLSEPRNPPLTTEQCQDTIRTLSTNEADIDTLREGAKKQQP